MEILLYLGHPCLFSNLTQKILCLYKSAVLSNTLARGPHVARGQLLCSPRMLSESRTYTKS